MSKHLTVALAVVLVAATAISTASATPPDRVRFVSSFSFEDTTTCPGMTILQSNEERDTIVEFSSGLLHIQRHGVATLSANGKTLTSNFSATIFWDPSTTVQKVVGTVYNIQVPGVGNLLLDVGNVIFDFSTQPLTVLRLAGPHQQFSGDVGALCAYFAAP
jgi:hypothetical protein